VTEPSHAVFLSYASEDAEAAQRICDALRGAGIEVWFDQSALRGGDVWDQAIRKQIKTCVLFIPVISRHTHQREEGYFRLEWKLAVDRSHLMTSNKTFLLPVVIDDTREDDENVPERFKEIHWTRLPAGETPSSFVDRVHHLMSRQPSLAPAITGSAVGPVSSAAMAVGTRFGGPKRAMEAIVAVAIFGVLAYLVVDKASKRSVPTPTPAIAAAREIPAAFSPPPHSIAVLPFVNMSGDKDQEYFSQGLTEELLNSLSRINELQVAAPTSSFSFKGDHPDISAVAQKLNVGAVLEGSVRRAGHTVRITAQLINGVTGFHLWSQTYDRDLRDVLKLQTEIATGVAGALKVTLLGDEAARIEVGGTHNPAAFDAYLRALKVYQSRNEDTEITSAIADYTEAIRQDPNFALAFAERSYALVNYAAGVESGAAMRKDFEKAEEDAHHAIALAPELAQAHMALAWASEAGILDISRANEEYSRALALAPGDAEVLWNSGRFTAKIGHFEAGISATRRAVILDPLGRLSHSNLGRALFSARRFAEAATAFAQVRTLNPKFKQNYGEWGLALYELGDFDKARRTCEAGRDNEGSNFCLALVYDKLNRHEDAEAELSKLKALSGDDAAYAYAEIYAQRGDRPRALEWLAIALRSRFAGVSTLATGLDFLRCDPLLDPLRKEPRFQAIERELKFPD